VKRIRADSVGAGGGFYSPQIFFRGLHYLPHVFAGEHLRGPSQKIVFFGGPLSVAANKNWFSLAVYGPPLLDMFLLAVFTYGRQRK
jgi:hypothetical protein